MTNIDRAKYLYGKPTFNSPINYFYIVHYWLYSRFAKLSSANLLQKAICQTKVLPNFIFYGSLIKTITINLII